MMTTYTMPSKEGKYGSFGGRFVPELLMPALLELERAYEEAMQDEVFLQEFQDYLTDYVGTPVKILHLALLLHRLYEEAMQDEVFLQEFQDYLTDYVGRETPLYEAKNFAKAIGKSRV